MTVRKCITLRMRKEWAFSPHTGHSMTQCKRIPSRLKWSLLAVMMPPEPKGRAAIALFFVTRASRPAIHRGYIFGPSWIDAIRARTSPDRQSCWRHETRRCETRGQRRANAKMPREKRPLPQLTVEFSGSSSLSFRCDGVKRRARIAFHNASDPA